ncbi:MAG: type II secretion system protein [Lentisphaeria bacterium]|nr:type II secretion system protein [Lentisphaeria bacterium]
MHDALFHTVTPFGSMMPKYLKVRDMREKKFTLLEVMVAALILGLSLVLTLQILGTARGRILRAQRRWARTHVLEQGLEFHLLTGPDEEIPPAFLPEGFSVVCEALDPADLPDYADQPIAGKTLARMKVTVYGVDKEETSSFTMEKTMEQKGY